ncbi:MAG: nucleotidyltransferase domain-containing protein [Candidatus Diapherotrites archaeon]|nr:nucleotidyltransferase domain-containing protein [Candidatus Diapherotrites archaeon]
MIKDFGKFAGNKVLSFFAFNPKKEVHINGLARELNISVSTAKHYCDILLKANTLLVRAQGNQKIFSLNNAYFLVKELKKTIALANFNELGIDSLVNENAYSLAIYGSFVSGEFDEKSDLDILVIGEKQDVDFRLVSKFEQVIKREVQLSIYSWLKWRKMEQDKEPFVFEVQRKNILIKGNKI